MRNFLNRIETEPELDDINEILLWLKDEKEQNPYGDGFYNNRNIIVDSFHSNRTIVFKNKNMNIGLLTWSDDDDILVNIDIFVIHPDYRGEGYGEFYYRIVSDYFRTQGFKIVKLFCEPKTSESFWKKLGLNKFPNCGYTEHPLTYYDILVDIASTTYIRNAYKIELWDVEPYQADEIASKWTWFVEIDKDELLYPIIHTCNCNWNIRLSYDGKTLKEEKVKYFTDEDYEVYHSKFLLVDRVEL